MTNNSNYLNSLEKEDILSVCVGCKAIKPGEEWIPKNSPQYDLHRVFYLAESHGYCNPCLEEEIEKIERFHKERTRTNEAKELFERVDERRAL